MQSQDVITYKQDIFKIISDEEIAQYFQDENYMDLLVFLRKGPMTIDEIEDAYRLAGNEKSIKTIYRYLRTLEEAGLVVQAGKRIVTYENRNKSYTIYTRTAKVFLDNVSEILDKQMNRKIKFINILLKDLYDGQVVSEECLRDFLIKIQTKMRNNIKKLFENHSEEASKQIEDLDYHEINDLLNLVGWLVISHKTDIKDEIAKCFSKKD
ncbi:MAG: hypothetical protein U9O98_09385 [Asgard group archaeon]|nr:hypothetical protein [Asgard group archaeon]